MVNPVMKVDEKRGTPRHSAEIGIVCQPYSSCGTIRHFSGTLRNYSCGGIYIETPHEFKTGTILLIRTTHSAAPSSFHVCKEGLRTICLAEVKWQQELSDPRGPCFGTGLRYMN